MTSEDKLSTSSILIDHTRHYYIRHKNCKCSIDNTNSAPLEKSFSECRYCHKKLDNKAKFLSKMIEFNHGKR